ncbi:MAG: MATE family efflux transporter [Saprospiraceae bacterium]|nr:MATE family efflux transporter [Candidatus Vicinibacter affinis]
MKKQFIPFREYKEIFSLAIPIIIGNLSQMMLNIIDAMMVGRLGYKELAASSLVNNILSIPFVACIGLTTVIAPMVAECRGKNKIRETGMLLFNTKLVVAVVTFLIILLLLIFRNVVYHLNQDPEVVTLGIPFFKWMCWSIFPMIIFLSVKQFYDGLERTRLPMILSFLSIGINALLNYILVFGNFGFPRLELEGSGMATFITRVIIMLVLIIHLFFSGSFAGYGLHFRKINFYLIQKFLKLSIPSAWQYASEVGAFAVLAIIVGWFGAIQLAAHHVAISIAAFAFMFSMGLSTSASIKVGEALGKADLSLARHYGRMIVNIAIVYGILVAMIFIFFRGLIPLAFNENEKVVFLASQLLLLAAAFQVSDALQAVGIGLLRGLQDVRVPTVLTTISYWFIGIPSGYLLATYFELKAFGVWIGFVICLSFMAYFLIRRFYRITRLKDS